MASINPHCDQVHGDKYRLPGETFPEAMDRVAAGLATDPVHYRKLRDILHDRRFLPPGRVQAAVGSGKNVTLFNCFVSAAIHDSFVHGDEAGRNSIMDVARQAAATMRMGGGIGYDFSTLRPAGEEIRGVRSQTDGPLAFLPINDAVCRATSSAGNRRGAQMGVLRVDHPDIRAFIRAKQVPPELMVLWEHVESLPASHPGRASLAAALQHTLRLTGFNLSIGVTDEFMHALDDCQSFELRYGGKVYEEVDPRELWDEVMTSTWEWAEPGVLFIDTINRMNNLRYCEQIAATNPCGEQPLPPHGACLLGSWCLPRYLTRSDLGGWDMDWAQLREDVGPVVKAMDRAIDISLFPLPEQEREARAKRRMGLGVTGLANAAEACGASYGRPDFLAFEAQTLSLIRDHTYQSSMELARELGEFPLMDRARYCQGEFIRTLPRELQRDIQRNGIRNSHLTSIAPTGTISYTADNVSSSIEPVFMYRGQRRMKTPEGEVIVDVEDYGYKVLGVRGRLAEEVTAEEHVAVLCRASKYVDSAVSKTCNVSPSMPRDQFESLYYSAWEGGAKGCTTFNPGGRRLGIFTPAPEPELTGQSCTFDPATGRRNCE